tara:strand:+ start:386 stop:1078 length:693 start_codon:yes stop_codon:yes gene_type:complete
MTKIYCDIADLKLIKKFNKKSLVKGFTTNPSLMRSAGAKNYEEYSKKILNITKKPISFEVFADNIDEMISQGIHISQWGKNVYVKIPVVNSKGIFTGRAIKYLNDKNIKLNITAVYNFGQIKKILKNINKNSKVIISIFAGRMADAGKDPKSVLIDGIRLSKKNKNVQILWASTREAYNYTEAKKLGCDIITIPPKIIEIIEKFGKTTRKLTIDTVKGFLKDSKRSKFKI